MTHKSYIEHIFIPVGLGYSYYQSEYKSSVNPAKFLVHR